MKRLSQETAHIQRRKKPAVIKASDLLKVTIPVITEDEAIGRKEKFLNAKLFGLFSPVKYEIKAVRKVYVPFELLIFSYEVNFGGNPDRRSLFCIATGRLQLFSILKKITDSTLI